MFKVSNLAKITRVPFVMPVAEDFPDGNVKLTFFIDGKFATEKLIGMEMRCTAASNGEKWAQPQYNFYNAMHFINMYDWHYPVLQPLLDSLNSLVMIGYFPYIEG